MNEKLQSVREWVQAACPEVMGLKEGCLVEFETSESAGRGRVLTETYEGFICYIFGEAFKLQRQDIKKVLGSKIGICEILRTIEPIDRAGDAGIYSSEIIIGGYIPSWDLLHDDLNLQSQETVDYLYSLIPKK